jgi:hypothetical protein
MIIDTLIEILSEYRDELGGDAEVRLMTQQNWPFENHICGLTSGQEMNDTTDEDADDDQDVTDDAVVYIVEGGQIGYDLGRGFMPTEQMLAFWANPRVAVGTWHNDMALRAVDILLPSATSLRRNSALHVNASPIAIGACAGDHLGNLVSFTTLPASDVHPIGFGDDDYPRSETGTALVATATGHEF